MAYNGALLLDDDGKIRLNDDGEASNDSVCEMDCGTTAGPLKLTPPNQTSTFCTCCVPDGWDIDCHFTTTGPQDYGKVVIEYGPGDPPFDSPCGTIARCPTVNVTSPQQTVSLDGIEGGGIAALGGIIPAQIAIKTYAPQDDCDHVHSVLDGSIAGDNACCVFNNYSEPHSRLNTLPECISWSLTTTTLKCASVSITDQYTAATDSTPAKYKWILNISGADGRYDDDYAYIYDIFYGEHEFTADDSGEFHYDCRTELEFTSAANPLIGQMVHPFIFGPAVPYKSLPLGSGGTVTLRPCTTHPILKKCADPATETTGGRCLFQWSNNSGGVYPTFHWTNWNLVSSTYVPPGTALPLPPVVQLNVPVIDVAENGSCSATIYTVGKSDLVGGCPNPVPPSAVPSSYKCKPRFACVKIWQSFHLATGWSTPTAVVGGVICIDTQNVQTPLDAWGPLQDDCSKYFCQYLSHTCIGTSDTTTCAGLNSTAVPAVPTDNPDCFAEDLAAGCSGCPSRSPDPNDGMIWLFQKCPDGSYQLISNNPIIIGSQSFTGCDSGDYGTSGDHPCSDGVASIGKRDIVTCYAADMPTPS